MILLTVNYLFAHDPARNPFASQSDSSAPSPSARPWQANSIDLQFLDTFRRLFRIRGKWLRAGAVIDEVKKRIVTALCSC